MTGAEFNKSKKRVALPGGTVASVDRGEGAATLFVHGVLVNSYIWRHQIERFSGERRCIAVDLLGHGDSEAAAGSDLTSVGQARMIGDLVDALAIETFDLVGNDGGGGIAQLLAVARPQQVRSLTLTNCDTHDNWPPEAFKGFVEMCARGELNGVLEAMNADKNIYRSPEGLGPCYERPDSVSDDTIATYLQPFLRSRAQLKALEAFVAAFDNRQTVAVEGQLRQLRAPTLIAWGDDDVYFDVKWAEWLARTIPGTRKKAVLPGARLFFFEERPEEFNTLLAEHLKVAGELLTTHA
jgi:pimeloyl-ACP methyl ester carboxylesterase